jgi:MFS family permease
MRLFLTGQLTKLIGVWMLFIAQDWLVLELTDKSGTALGLVTALQFTPVLLLTLYGGKLADRFDKQKLLSPATSSSRAGPRSACWSPRTRCCCGTCSRSRPAGRDLRDRDADAAGVLVGAGGPELLPNALSLGSATFNVARLVGPAIAGVAIALWGTGVVILITVRCAWRRWCCSCGSARPSLHRAEPGTVAARDARVIDGCATSAAGPT